jgi:integrase
VFSQWITIYGYPSNRSICSLTTLRRYLKRSSAGPLDINVDGLITMGLFRALDAGGSLKAGSIAKISTVGMQMAGVPKHFRSQSLRSAAASAAMDNGATMDMVLQQGRWSSAAMFKKYYYRSLPRLARKDAADISAYIRAGIGPNFSVALNVIVIC